MIRFVRGNEIDRNKWDNCIACSLTGHIYGYSWYLDLVAPGWAGIIKGDYEAIMPLPLKRKLGINYVFQPLQAQQLGVYTSQKNDESITLDFLKAIPGVIKYIDLNLNYTDYSDKLHLKVHGLKLTEKINFDLNLNRDYQQIHMSFSLNTRRNIQKAVKAAVLKEDISILQMVNFHRQNQRIKMPEEYYRWMTHYCNTLIDRGSAQIIGAETEGETGAVAFFVNNDKRIYYFLPVSSQKGRKAGAMFLVIDSVIRNYAGKDMILDFEGSIIPGIARFFEGFGARPSLYPGIVINRMPFWLRVLKKLKN